MGGIRANSSGRFLRKSGFFENRIIAHISAPMRAIDLKFFLGPPMGCPKILAYLGVRYLQKNFGFFRIFGFFASETDSTWSLGPTLKILRKSVH